MPKLPQHPYCHCTAKSLPVDKIVNDVKAESKVSKFDAYLFNTYNRHSDSKRKLFDEWGYGIEDSRYLMEVYINQARSKYINGEYFLGKLDEYGQRISIRIEIPKKGSMDTVSFITGWMVHPNGTIQLATPYGGKQYERTRLH